MNSIICPKCGEVFTIDENSYADIVKQVRDDEFKKEREKRCAETSQLDKLNYEKELHDIEAKKNLEIERLKSAIREKENASKAEILKETADRDKTIAELTAVA